MKRKTGGVGATLSSIRSTPQRGPNTNQNRSSSRPIKTIPPGSSIPLLPNPVQTPVRPHKYSSLRMGTKKTSEAQSSTLSVIPPKDPPINQIVMFMDCDKDELETIQMDKCKFAPRNEGTDSLFIQIVQQIMEELLMNPLLFPPGRFMLIDVLVGFIVDEIALIAKAQDQELFKKLLKIGVSMHINTPKQASVTTLVVRFSAKNIRDLLQFHKLDQLMKMIASNMLQEIKYNVNHRMELHTMRLL